MVDKLLLAFYSVLDTISILPYAYRAHLIVLVHQPAFEGGEQDRRGDSSEETTNLERENTVDYEICRERRSQGWIKIINKTHLLG